MLASISGLSEVVRLLLGAGADVQIKDRLGLTAIDWSKRRGFSEVAELLVNFAKRDAVSAQTTVAGTPETHTKSELAAPGSEEPEGPARQEGGNWETERPRLDHVARIQALFDTSTVSLRPGQEQNPIDLEQERRSAEAERAANELAREKSRLETERFAGETRKRVEEEVRKKALREEQEAIRIEQERRKVEEERATNELARERSRLETERIAEESRKRVEAEIRKKAQREEQEVLKSEQELLKAEQERAATALPRMKSALATETIPKEPRKQEEVRKTLPLRKTRIITEDIWPVPPVSSVGLAATTTESVSAGESSRNCATDNLTMISAADSSFSQPPANVLARPTVWMLMVITLAGGVLIGYQLNDYVSKKDERPSAPIAAAPVEKPVSVKPEVTPEVTPNLPLVGGDLGGAEANIPEPEYPARAKSEGVAGTITVRVRVNKRGRVILARSSTGDWRLRAAAVQAAKKASFLPEKFPPDERFVSGTITYTFKP